MTENKSQLFPSGEKLRELIDSYKEGRKAENALHEAFMKAAQNCKDGIFSRCAKKEAARD